MRSQVSEKAHAVCIPFPSQGHVNPMLKLAKLLHFRGFHITFVNTEFNHQRLVRSGGSESLKGLDDFRFETIPDGLPPSNSDATQDVPALCKSIQNNCLVPFRDLITKLNDSPDVPSVTSIVSDGVTSFTLQAAQELHIPSVVFFTISACGFMGYLYYDQLVARGYVPFKDETCFTNGYLDTEIDWIPGMKGIRLKDLPSFIRTTNADDIMLNYNMEQTRDAFKAKALLLNTFDGLENEVLDAIRSKFPHVYTIGPVQLLHSQLPEGELKLIGSSLWKEEVGCLEWLDQWEPNGVVYVNFGSVVVMTPQQLMELAWGLANSNHPFLWIIRPDLVTGESAVLTQEFVQQTRERGMLQRWCSQEKVLAHPSVGGFLTHSGWNSTVESISEGVPMICWPFSAEQPTNCRYACTDWAVGMEISSDVKREEVEGLVKELMKGAKGREMRKKALEWKEKAHLATIPGGSSYFNFEKLVKEIRTG